MTTTCLAPTPTGGRLRWGRVAVTLDAPPALTPTLSQGEREEQP